MSLRFWYIGLIPDLATLRDRAQSRFPQVVYGIFALGWRGDALHWLRYQKAYVLLAALATPLVISVHSVVSFDFAVSIVPGWHSTVFPPYFVGGAIFSGFAMVLTIAIPLRAFYGLHAMITARHLDKMAKVMLASGLIVAYGYATENFIAWYSGHDAERFAVMNRVSGPYAVLFWTQMIANVAIPQLLWFPAVRGNVYALFALSLIINVAATQWLAASTSGVIHLER